MYIRRAFFTEFLENNVISGKLKYKHLIKCTASKPITKDRHNRQPMAHSLTFLLALFLCSVIVPVLVRYSHKLGLMDDPSEARKAHSKAVPRSGGIAIFLGASLTILTTAGTLLDDVTGLLLAGAVIFTFGLIDDLRNLNYWWKFIGQFGAAGLAISSGVILQTLPFIGDTGPYWLYFGVTLIFLVGVTNAINLSDGLDGLAGGSTFLCLGLIAFLSYLLDNYVVTLLSLALMGGIAGFLRFNTHPATIFMGDSGSQFIGLMAGMLAIIATRNEYFGFSSSLPLLIFGLPIFDTLYVILIRIKNGKPPFQADDSHLHHRLMRLGIAQEGSVSVYYLAQAGLLLTLFTQRYSSDAILFLTYFSFCGIALGALVLAKRLRSNGDANTQPERDQRNTFFRLLGNYFTFATAALPYALLASLVIALASSMNLAVPETQKSMYIYVALGLLPLWLFSLFRSAENSPKWLTRLITLASMSAVFYHSSFIELTAANRYVTDAALLALLIFLALCIRISRKQVFALTTQDLLIILVLMSVQVFPIPEASQYMLMRMTIYIFVIEYLIAIGKPPGRWFLTGSVAATAILAYI